MDKFRLSRKDKHYGGIPVKNLNFQKLVRDTIPVIAGYIVLGMGFGIIMKTNGYSIWLALAMSLFIYAGSMQYAAIGLFTGGASMLTVALTTLAVNARHIFYGISMVDKYKDAGIRKNYMIFALTDETYSLVCDTDQGTNYCFFVSLLDQCYWILGTVIGSVLGSKINFNTKGIDFALTALFLTVFIEQWIKNKNHFPAVTGVLASAICLIIFGQSNFLIPSTLIIAAILLLNMKKEQKHDK